MNLIIDRQYIIVTGLCTQEDELDRKLFVRTNKKVILTEEGVLFRETAEEICAAIDKGTADIGYIVQSVNTMKYEVFSLNTSEQWGILVNRNHRLAAKEYVAATYTLFRNAMILTELSDWVTICLETRKYTGDNLVFVPFSPLKTSSASLIWKKRAVYSPAMHEFLSCFGIRNLNDR